MSHLKKSVLCIFLLEIHDFYKKPHHTEVLEITAGHWPFLTNFNIWLTKIYFGRPNLLYIFNGKAINNPQNVPSSKKPVANF